MGPMAGTPKARPGSRAIVYSLLLIVLLLACGLRFYGLDAQSLWNDEGSSVALAQRDPLTIARDAARDIHPPLYYWLLSGWVRLAGDSEVGVRSLSALLGVVLVALTYLLGRFVGGRWVGLAAAFWATINPFQVYYAQEARMYMLLAVWGALAFYAALRWAAAGPEERIHGWAAAYVLAAAAGLYTHYAFPLALLAANLVVLPLLLWPGEGQAGRRPLGRWIGLQVLAGLLFLPWLPIAYRQLTTWPRVEGDVAILDALSQIARLFTTGPAASPWTETGWMFLLLLLVFYPNRRSRRLRPLVADLAPIVWLVLPIVLILGLGLFKDAYLKFLLVASPAFCLLAGRVVIPPPWRQRSVWPVAATLARGGIGLLLLAASLHGLGDYFTKPAYARDDYRTIAAYLEAVGRPGDAVLLNAPGQQEVFDYYYGGDLPVYPLPESRPLEPVATRHALEDLAQPGGRVFAVLWATDESDPERFIEGWLDSHAYKALDSWYGNVRLAVYAVPERAPSSPGQVLDTTLVSAETGDEIRLLGYSLLDDELAAGDIAQITLFWQAEEMPVGRYKVFIHVLDGADQIVGQRDAEPGGGARLTTLWAPGETIVDNYGVPLHPATPPGNYRVEVGMYDPGTGQRLVTQDGAGQVWLEPLQVGRPVTPAPVAALGMQHSAAAGFGDLLLLGYDAHKLGFAHQPDAPLRPGEVLHLNLYWRAEAQPGGDWRLAVGLVDGDGRVVTGLEGEPVPGYSAGRWQAGDVWRGQFNLPLPAATPPGRYWLRVQPLPAGGSAPTPLQIGPIRIGSIKVVP